MPEIEWQFAIVVFCLAVAALVVARRAWRLVGGGRSAKGTGCGACGGCSPSATAGGETEPAVVSLKFIVCDPAAPESDDGRPQPANSRRV
ncbi:MAG: hypothetical protein ACKV0T_03955 [Planctomycetales bacterium]